MLESLVWSIVERYADIYIKGFKPDSLKVSLWEGEITLSNVELNTDALNLPIKLQRGFVQSVKARIPWTKLTEKPVIVHVRGVALEIVPNDAYVPGTARVQPLRKSATAANGSASATNGAATAADGAAAVNSGAAATAASGGDGEAFAPADTDTFSGRVRQAVIDNIQFQISDVHVSFREPSSSAVIHFSIDSLRLQPLAGAAPSPAPSPRSRSRSDSSTTPESLLGAVVGAIAAEAVAHLCAHLDCAAHPWPDLRRELAMLERVLCRQLVVNNISAFVEEAGDVLSESIWNRVRRKPAPSEPLDAAATPYANLHCLARDIGLRATLTTSPSSLFFATLVVERAIRLHIRDLDVKLVCVFVNQVRYLLEQVSGSNGDAAPRPSEPRAPPPPPPPTAPLASEHVRELWENTQWIWGVAAQPPTSPRVAETKATKRRSKQLEPVDEAAAMGASALAGEFSPLGDPFRGLFCEVDVAAIELLVTEHLEHADVLVNAVEVIERDLARVTLERLRLRLSARTNELHCHMSLGAPSLVSLIDVNSSGVPLFAPIAAAAGAADDQQSDWLHVAYTHVTNKQPDLRVAVRPVLLVVAPLLLSRLARVASIVEPYARAAPVEPRGSRAKADDRATSADSDDVAPLSRAEAAEEAYVLSQRLDASFRRVALNDLRSLTQQIGDAAPPQNKVRVCVTAPRVHVALAVDTASVGASRLVFECAGVQAANFVDGVDPADDDTILRLQLAHVSASLRDKPLIRPTELEAFVRAPRGDGGVRIDAEVSVLRFNVDRSVVRELEAMFSRAGLQWNRGIDSNEHVWRAPTSSRAPAAATSAARRRPPRIVGNWRTLLPPAPRSLVRPNATLYRVSLLAKSVVIALGAPDSPVAEVRADSVCGTASGHTRTGRDCTRVALSVGELAAVVFDGAREQVLLSASADAAQPPAAPASPPPSLGRSMYSTPAALDRTMYGTPLGRSFAPPASSSRLGLDSMRLDSPFRDAAPAFDEQHHSRDAARGAPLPFQAEQRFMSPDASLLLSTPERSNGGVEASTPLSALSAFRRAGGRMFADLRAPALTVSFVEVRVPDAPSTLPSVKLALSLEGVRAVYSSRGFASIERALAAPATARPRPDAQPLRLESLSAAQVRWQYLTLRLLQRARERLLWASAAAPAEYTHSDDEDGSDGDERVRSGAVRGVVRYANHASWCRLLAARVARNPPHWLKWSDLSIFLEAMLTKISISLDKCVVSLPQQTDSGGAVPRLDFIVPHAQMRSLTRSGRALGAMVLSGQLVDVLVVLAQPEVAADADVGATDDAAVDDDSDGRAVAFLPPFYRACAGAVRTVVVLRKDKLAARLVSRLNWRRSSSAVPADDDIVDDDDDGNAPFAASTAVALNSLDVFVGDLDVRMPIDEVRVFGGVIRSLGSRTDPRASAHAAPPPPTATTATSDSLQKYHFRVFARHARAAVDCAGSKTSQVHSVDAVQSLAIESRAASLAVALHVNGDLSLALDFDALLCHCVSDDVTFALNESQLEATASASTVSLGNVLRPLADGTRRVIGGPVHGDHERLPHLRFEVDVLAHGGPSRLRWLLRGHELRLQPRVSRVLRSMWRAMRGSVDDKVSPIFDDVDPQKTPSTGLDVTLRVEDSTVLFLSPQVTYAIASDAMCARLQTERGVTSVIQFAADDCSIVTIDELFVDELVAVRDVVFSMHLVDVAGDDVAVLDDVDRDLAHFLASLVGFRENAVLELSARLRRLTARVAPSVGLCALQLAAASFVLFDNTPQRSLAELGEALYAEMHSSRAWLHAHVTDVLWAASVSSRALASDWHIGAVDAQVVSATLARVPTNRRRRQRNAVLASLLTLRTFSVATVIGDASVLPLLSIDATDALSSAVLVFERESQRGPRASTTALTRVSYPAGDDDSESSASSSAAASSHAFATVAAASPASIQRLSIPRVASEHALIARPSSSLNLASLLTSAPPVDWALTVRVDSLAVSVPLSEAVFQASRSALTAAAKLDGGVPSEAVGAPSTSSSPPPRRKMPLRQRVRLAVWFECGAIKAQCVDADGVALSVELNSNVIESVVLLDNLQSSFARIDDATLCSAHARVDSVVSLALVAPRAPHERTASAMQLTLSFSSRRHLAIAATFPRHQRGLTPGWQVSIAMLRLAAQLQARLSSLERRETPPRAAAGAPSSLVRAVRVSIVLPDGFAASCMRDETEVVRLRVGRASISCERADADADTRVVLDLCALELQCINDCAPVPVVLQVCDLLGDGAASVVGVQVDLTPAGDVDVRVRLAPDVLLHADCRLLAALQQDLAPFAQVLASMRAPAAAPVAAAAAPAQAASASRQVALDAFTLHARVVMLPVLAMLPAWLRALIGDTGDIAISFGAFRGDARALQQHFERALWRHAPRQVLCNWLALGPLHAQLLAVSDAMREPAADVTERFAVWFADALAALARSVENGADVVLTALVAAAYDTAADAMQEQRRLLHRRASAQLPTLVQNLQHDVGLVGRRFAAGWSDLKALARPQQMWRLARLLQQCLALAGAANCDALTLTLRRARRHLPVSSAMRLRDRLADAKRVRLHRAVEAVPQQLDARWTDAVASCVLSLDGARSDRRQRACRLLLANSELCVEGVAVVPLSAIGAAVTVDIDPFAVLLESSDGALPSALLGVDDQSSVVLTWAARADRDAFLDDLAATKIARQHLHWQNLL